MPNHLHGIISITESNTVGVPLVGTHSTEQDEGQAQGTAPTWGKSIGEIIGAFKSITTNEYIKGVKNDNWEYFNRKLWQRNYYEHIIRNEKSLENIRNYIFNNPLNWKDDEMFMP